MNGFFIIFLYRSQYCPLWKGIPVRDGANFVQGLFSTIDPVGPGQEQQPSDDDIWQAASLLIGVYGRDALEYAVQRKDDLEDSGDRTDAMTWQLILSKVEVLLRGSPFAHMT